MSRTITFMDDSLNKNFINFPSKKRQFKIAEVPVDFAVRILQMSTRNYIFSFIINVPLSYYIFGNLWKLETFHLKEWEYLFLLNAS